MRAFGVDEDQIKSVAANLIWCDLIGRHNHGVERLPILMKRVRQGLIRCPCRLQYERLSDCIELVDGDDGFGHYCGEKAVAHAIALAQAHGVGIVGVRNSNFFGAGAFFVNKATTNGMISLALSNSFPKVAAHGGAEAVLGTNPFAFGAPRSNGRSLILDMSTAALAGSTIREQIRKGLLLPEGLLVDAGGQSVADPNKSAASVLLPFGGAKGFGLALLVEILSGVITGAAVSHGVVSMYNNFKESGHNGHFFLALDIKRWMPLEVYYERLESLIATIKKSGPDGRVQMPGENRWRFFDDNSAKGIPLELETLKALRDLSDECHISVPWSAT